MAGSRVQRSVAGMRHDALLVCALIASFPAAQSPAQDETDRPPPPERYVLDYPDADRCCAPIRSTFVEVTRTMGVVRGRRFRQQLNGGYGLPVVDQVQGKHLLHVGADLGWYQVGEPVFAVAAGVVRTSTGPQFEADQSAARAPAGMPWGHLVVIEHRFAGDQYFTSVYGHLGADRGVQTGDIVTAGEQIGTIGRQHYRINGGYKPHLHFAVREGRMAEVGSTLAQLTAAGRQFPLMLEALGEQWSEVRLPDELPVPAHIEFNGRRFEVRRRDEKTLIRSALLWEIQRPDFALVGYALSTDGWRDPVGFLREHQADIAPAPYRATPQRPR